MLCAFLCVRDHVACDERGRREECYLYYISHPVVYQLFPYNKKEENKTKRHSLGERVPGFLNIVHSCCWNCRTIFLFMLSYCDPSWCAFFCPFIFPWRSRCTTGSASFRRRCRQISGHCSFETLPRLSPCRGRICRRLDLEPNNPG